LFWDRNLIVTSAIDVNKFDFEQLRSNNLPSCVEYSAKDFKITVNSVAGTQGTYNMYLVATVSTAD
jgi:hypothetical protein